MSAVAVACLACTAHVPLPAPAAVAPKVAPAPPSGWKATPQLARAAAKAVGVEAVTVVASAAWSEPTLGCYAVWLQLMGLPLPTDRGAKQLVTGLQRAGFSVGEVAALSAIERGVLGLVFAKTPYRGQLRAALAKTGELEAIACAWNPREPSICAPACAELTKAVR